MAFFFFRRSSQPIKKNKKTKNSTNPVKLGLALGGGGARGFAHIGVLKAFEEAGIEFDMVSGTSVGSIVAAAHCYGLSAAELTDIANEVEVKDVRDKNVLFASDPNNIGRLLKQAVGDVKFSDMSRPLYIVAVDLKTSSEVVIESGSVANAVSASCAVPMIFRPLVSGRYHLVDGGVLNNIPADVLKVRGCDKVVAVDINSGRGEGTDSLNRLNVIGATFRIMLANSSVKGMVQSDVVIRPDTKRFSASRKVGYLEMIQEGYNAAMEHIEEIKALVNPPA